MRMINATDTYFEYFDKLPSRSKNLSSDITPSYAGLNGVKLNQIVSGFEERGIKIKIIFLMREPVERVISTFFMYKKRNFLHIPGIANPIIDSGLIEFSRSRECILRTSYEDTISSLECLDESEIFYGFYEELFENKSFEDLYNFVGNPPPAETRLELEKELINRGRKTGISEETKSCIFEAYFETYSVCKSKFPIVSTIWKEHNY